MTSEQLLLLRERSDAFGRTSKAQRIGPLIVVFLLTLFLYFFFLILILIFDMIVVVVVEMVVLIVGGDSLDCRGLIGPFDVSNNDLISIGNILNEESPSVFIGNDMESC